MAHNELDTYEKLRKNGHTEEQALSEVREFVKTEHTRAANNEYVTRQDLKIALLEFAKEYKLEIVNVKLTFLISAIIVGFSATGTALGFIFKLLFEISSKLPQ